jgi:hypothetical protein
MRGYYYDFFSYTTSVGKNLVTNGVLSTVDGATTNNCKQGAFLRETGRRLYPGANPGVSTMLVSVFDFKTGLTGFIDPNSEAFTPQNSDRAYYIDSAGYNPNHKVSSDLRSDQGPPVYTHGDVLADGDMYIGGNASTIGNVYVQGNVSTASNLAVGGNSHILGNASTMGSYFIQGNISTTQTINAGAGINFKGPLVNTNVATLTQNGSETKTLDCSTANVFIIAINADTAFSVTATNVSTGQPVWLIFNNTPTGNNNPLVTLGDNIREYFNSGAQSLQIIDNQDATMSFIGFGSDLLELSRMIVNPS